MGVFCKNRNRNRNKKHKELIIAARITTTKNCAPCVSVCVCACVFAAAGVQYSDQSNFNNIWRAHFKNQRESAKRHKQTPKSKAKPNRKRFSVFCCVLLRLLLLHCCCFIGAQRAAYANVVCDYDFLP